MLTIEARYAQVFADIIPVEGNFMTYLSEPPRYQAERELEEALQGYDCTEDEEAIYPAIRELDLETARSWGRAHRIAVSNDF